MLKIRENTVNHEGSIDGEGNKAGKGEINNISSLRRWDT